MKKHLALVLALVMVLSSFSFVSAAPDFADVDGTVYEEAVDRLELLNILKGYPDGTFRPEDTITRAEFAAVAVRVSGLENVAMAAKGLPTGFTDVPAHHWASGYVGTAAKMGIVNGIGNGLFAPETPVKYEEAITMVVRALGYEPMAQARGGYPFGYLIVANEIDLLEDAMGTQGTWATRGFVAQITDNALEIEMMIQVGYGSDTKWVVSGEEDTDKEYLLDRMGFNTVEGRVTQVDVDDMEIYIDAEDRDDDGWYDVATGFDFYAVEGVEVKVWLDGDMVILASAQEDVSFDAVEVDGDEVTLVGEDKDYDLADDAMLFVDGEEKDFDDADNDEYDYAKVVFNEDGDVIWVDAVEVLEFIVVDEMDDEVVLDLNEDELDAEDFLVVEAGKTISLDDLEEGDIVFFLADDYFDYDGFAVVYNESEVGEITRVYSDAQSEFRLDGTNYKYVADAKYLDGEDLDELTADILDGMMDEEEEVEVFFDFNGDVVLVSGNTGVASTDTFYAVLTDDTIQYDGRRGDMIAFDFLSEFGEELAYDLEVDDLDPVTGDPSIVNNFGSIGTTFKVLADTLFEITIDEDGDVEEIRNLESYMKEINIADEAFEIDDTYVEIDLEDFRLMSSTVIFYDGNDEVITLGEVDGEFSEVEAGRAYVKDGRVEVVVSAETDADTDTTDYTGLVTDVRVLRGGETEVTIEVAGVEMVFVTEDDDVTGADVVKENEIWTLTVGDTSEEIEKMEIVTPEMFNVVDVDISADTIEVDYTGSNTTRYESVDEIELTSDAVIYDESDDFAELRLRDVNDGDAIGVVFDGTSRYWAIYVVVDPAVETTEPVVEGVVTYINADDNDKVVESLTVESGTVLNLDVMFNNITDKNITLDFSGTDDTATYKIVNNDTGAVTTTTFALDTAASDVVVLKDKSVELGNIGNAMNTVGSFTILVEVVDGTTTYDSEFAVTVTATTADVNAAADVVDEIAALGSNPTKAAVTTADGNYQALSADAKALVTNYATLKAFTDDIADGAQVKTDITNLPADYTNKEVADVRADYDALGALGKGEVDNLATLTAAETALADAKTDLASAITSAQTLYDAQKARLDSFTAAEINAIDNADNDGDTNPDNGFTTYQTALSALKADLDAAKAVNVSADATLLSDITTAESDLTAEIGTFTTAKGVFDAIPEVVATGK